MKKIIRPQIGKYKHSRSLNQSFLHHIVAISTMLGRTAKTRHKRSSNLESSGRANKKDELASE